jgi:hypothetical protein
MKFKILFFELGSYTGHAVDRLPSDMAEAISPEARASYPPFVREHVRGSSHRPCHGPPRKWI